MITKSFVDFFKIREGMFINEITVNMVKIYGKMYSFGIISHGSCCVTKTQDMQCSLGSVYFSLSQCFAFTKIKRYYFS